ncbi:MAG: hypothetical protein JW908_16555 [Anaerolineales bacterium]|nr:hypothetical protein [Anaerolineales bacterium]
MKFKTRELVTLAVFGALWGLDEISVGALLKSLNVPFSGMFLAAIGLLILMIGRIFVPHKGSSVFIGAIATILKLFSLGGPVIGPMIGIMGEAIIAEIVLSIAQKPSRLSFILAGAAGVFWPLIQPFITGPLLFGLSLFSVWLDLLDIGNRFLGLDTSAALWIVLALIAIYWIVGGIAGWLAWDIGHILQVRLRRDTIDVTL